MRYKVTGSDRIFDSELAVATWKAGNCYASEGGSPSPW